MVAKPPPMDKTVELRVAECRARDVGRALARIDPETIQAVGATIGDVVELRGKGSTLCRLMPTFAEHRGEGRVQMDGVARDNAGVGLDSKVSLAVIPSKPANRVTLEPTDVAPTPRDLEYIGSRLDGVPVRAGQLLQVDLFGSRSTRFRVQATEPNGPVTIGPPTTLRLAPGHNAKSGPSQASQPPRLAYEDIGGLKPQLHRIREMIELPLRFPEVFGRLGIDPPKGVLLHGPPGCGKTLIARAIAHETDAAFFSIGGPEIIHKHYGESEKQLRGIFEQAAKRAPAIVFIDEVDAVAPKRDTVQGEVEKRVVAQLLALMDGVTKREQVIVIAATNLPNNIDPALRRPGRFDREIEVPIPDRFGRGHILEIHSRGMPLAEDVDLARVADLTHGCVGADLQALCREAAMSCLRPLIQDADFAAGGIDPRRLAELEVTMRDFEAALVEVQPSAIREVFVESPNVQWNDVGGLDEIKRELVEAVEWPLQHEALFDRARVRPARGVLLAGPPGVGKTLLAKATASQLSCNFISVKGPELLSKFVGESERSLREVFRKARLAAPCVIFFDEIDALLPRRAAGSGDGHTAERLLSQFLTEMDGVDELRGVLCLAATNRLDMLDEAVLRPGRFDRVIEIPRPNPATRRAILDVHLAERPLDDGVDRDALVRELEGASGAEIAAACNTAAMSAVRRAVSQQSDDHRIDETPIRIRQGDLEEAIRVHVPASRSGGGSGPRGQRETNGERLDQ